MPPDSSPADALSALLSPSAPSTLLHTGEPSQAAQPPSEPCPWHSQDLRRRQRFLLALQAPCPVCQVDPGTYCHSHTGLPLQAKVHHPRAELAERQACSCSAAEIIAMRSR